MINRRKFLGILGTGAAIGTVTACAPNTSTGCEENQSRAGTLAKAEFHWKMVTTWPKNFPGLGTGAEYLVNLIEKMSQGRLKITVYGANELVPAFGVFDAVADGAAEMGHGAAYYWGGKMPASPVFGAVPFGLTAEEMNGWLYHGGGLELWQALYQPFGVVPMPAGNTGVQMAGWFNKEINSLADLQGLKMRIPGLGSEVLRRAGATPVAMPGGELFTALQTGVLDAAEWVGPYNDLAFGMYKAAKYYYYPGWHEPTATLEVIFNSKALQQLPSDLQSIVRTACQAANLDMLSDYTAKNQKALNSLVNDHQVELRPLPQDVLSQLRAISTDVVTEIAKSSEAARFIVESYRNYYEQVIQWTRISVQAYLPVR